MLRAGRVKNRGSCPIGCKRDLRSPAGPALYSVGTGPRSPGMKGPKREADHSSFSAVMVCTGTTVSLPGVKIISSVQSFEKTLFTCSILFCCRNKQSRKQNFSEAASSSL